MLIVLQLCLMRGVQDNDAVAPRPLKNEISISGVF